MNWCRIFLRRTRELNPCSGEKGNEFGVWDSVRVNVRYFGIDRLRRLAEPAVKDGNGRSDLCSCPRIVVAHDSHERLDGLHPVPAGEFLNAEQVSWTAARIPGVASRKLPRNRTAG
jgi:hypothetical protein